MLDIVILAVVVAALVYQLYRVLGERNGSEPTPNTDPMAQPAPRTPQSVQNPLDRGLGAKPVQAQVLPGGAPALDEPLSVNQGLAQIKEYDSDFDERAFLQGARAAFEMIVKAYARGDLEILKNLLAPALYDKFAEDAKQRAQKDYTMETTLHALSSATIVAARMIGFAAEVTVEFISEQTSVVRDGAGSVIAGDSMAREEIRDAWVFRRETQSADPAWHLTETRD